jgi:hypothetical protein
MRRRTDIAPAWSERVVGITERGREPLASMSEFRPKKTFIGEGREMVWATSRRLRYVGYAPEIGRRPKRSRASASCRFC